MNLLMTHRSPAEAGRPFVTVSMDSSSVVGDAPPTAYVCRVAVAPGAGSGPEGASSPGAAPPPRASPAPTTGDFQGTVYRLQLPAGQADSLDVDALARAADARELLAQLEKLGQATVLYQAGQPVSLTSESVIHVGANKPLVAGKSRAENGERMDRLRYEPVGAIFRVSAEPIAGPTPRDVRIRLHTEMSDLAEGETEIAEGVPAVVLHSVEFTYTGGLNVGRPLLAVCLDASSDEKDANAVVYVCRAVLSNLR